MLVATPATNGVAGCALKGCRCALLRIENIGIVYGPSVSEPKRQAKEPRSIMTVILEMVATVRHISERVVSATSVMSLESKLDILIAQNMELAQRIAE